MNEAELVFSEIFGCDRFSLYLNKELPLTQEKGALISSILKRRFTSEPIQYILGKAEFMGLEFKVNPNVFIPRPETEILVEKTIRLVSGVRCLVPGIKIMDIGTGSGCIAVSLAKFLPEAQITATDISQEALDIAKENARLNNVKINFIHSNLFDAYDLTPNTYDLIISNPPYIPTLEIDKLQPEINYEPAIALDGGNNGLDFYRRIIQESPDHLRKGGLLVMEMGFGQRRKIENIFKNSGKFEIIEVVRDYNNIERVVIAKNG